MSNLVSQTLVVAEIATLKETSRQTDGHTDGQTDRRTNMTMLSPLQGLCRVRVRGGMPNVLYFLNRTRIN